MSIRLWWLHMQPIGTTQDPATGVMWVYPKSIAYDKILSMNLKVDEPSWPVPMRTGVLSPMTPLFG